jgi:ribosomal protein L29
MAKTKEHPEVEEMRGKDDRELRYELEATRKALFNARFEPPSESANPANIPAMRRRIARILTVLRQRELAGSKESKS